MPRGSPLLRRHRDAVVCRADSLGHCAGASHGRRDRMGRASALAASRSRPSARDRAANVGLTRSASPRAHLTLRSVGLCADRQRQVQSLTRSDARILARGLQSECCPARPGLAGAGCRSLPFTENPCTTIPGVSVSLRPAHCARWRPAAVERRRPLPTLPPPHLQRPQPPTPQPSRRVPRPAARRP